MKKIKKQSKKQLKQQISNLLNQICLKLEQNSLVNIQPILDSQNLKGLKSITREKAKILVGSIQNPSSIFLSDFKSHQDQNLSEIQQKNSNLIEKQKINLNYPLKTKNQKFSQDINTFDPKSVMATYNSYLVFKSEFNDYNLNYKNLFSKLVLSFNKTV